MVTCAVLGCDSSKRNNTHDRSFHQFPIDPVIREKWLRMLNRPNWTLYKYSTICSKHFEAQCFTVTTGQKRRKLRNGSVPTICMPVKLKHPRQPTTYHYRDIEPVPSTSASTSIGILVEAVVLGTASSNELTPRKRTMINNEADDNEEEIMKELWNKPRKRKKKKEAKDETTCTAILYENALATGVRIIVERVFNFFRKEYHYLTKNYGDIMDVTPFCKLHERTAAATGFHVDVVERFLREEAQSREISNPQKRQGNEKEKDQRDNSETESCDETFGSGQDSGTSSCQPADQRDHTYAMPYIEAPTDIVKDEPIDVTHESAVHEPSAGPSHGYESPTESGRSKAIMVDNESLLDTLRLMTVEKDPLKIEPDSFESSENSSDGSFTFKEETEIVEGYS